jgi:hypothetical protein
MGLFATLSYYALLILIPFLVIPFSRAATIVIIIEIFWFVVFHKYSLIDTTLPTVVAVTSSDKPKGVPINS